MFLNRASNCALCFGAALALLAPLGAARATSSYEVLHAFAGGSDGANADGGLIQDNAGNLYGTTITGGAGCGGEAGCGTVFKLAIDGSETVLYAFKGGNDGQFPNGSLIADSSGNLYGAAGVAGVNGNGTVFEVAPGGNETTLYAFKGGSDGGYPQGSPIFDANGNLDGTTAFGGGTGCSGQGCGTVFQLAPNGSETVLYAFAGGSDGELPLAGLVADKAGNLYGTTFHGGDATRCPATGCGTVFKLAPDGSETVLHAFKGGSDGKFPSGTLIADSSGNLYGTTISGGGTGCGGRGCGIVFKLTPAGSETVLYAFQGGRDGWLGGNGLVLDAKGNLYGTTSRGGNEGCRRRRGCGTVFELAPNGQETVLHEFHKMTGADPETGLIADSKGNLYGITPVGGQDCSDTGCGVVFELKK